MKSPADAISVEFDKRLPIFDKREEIVQSIRENQVTIVAGDTGSGKSTQLPLLCLEAGRGVAGRIGCTQPRRIAAVSLARFVSTRIHGGAGNTTGYKVRFHDKIDSATRIKFATDGMLLAEISGDPLLREYDTVIIDEAHERTINIDFLLGYFRTLLPKRPEFRLIITSATIDTNLFSRSFHRAPVITVSGRLFPVDIRYRPAVELWQGERVEGYTEAVVDAVAELVDNQEEGDILVFLPTVDDILEACYRLNVVTAPRNYEVLPLHSRLPLEQQERIFTRRGKAKIVVSTNIAETSLTVPNIRFVVDSGLARQLRFDPTAGISRMPIERISKASAQQRAGRCGRVRDGICIRLYSEQDFDSRPKYAAPEIRRANLAGVLLRMASLRLGRPQTFPFLQKPSPAALSAGYRKLKELGAMNAKGRLTKVGWNMARFPLDPPISRMLLAAREYHAVQEIAIIAAALSAQDPRDQGAGIHWRPGKSLAKKHASDFLLFLSLWEEAEACMAFESRRTLRRFSDSRGLSILRMREWRNTQEQIVRTCRRLHLLPRKPRKASVDAIHMSLLSGLIGNIAHRTSEGTYAGIGNHQIAIHPSSILFQRGPRWVLFHEIVETKKVYGRMAARIDPKWIEALFKPLCQYSWDSPVYDAEKGVVTAAEQVTLHGLPLITNRRIDLGPRDPGTAHDVFVCKGLVEEQIGKGFGFLAHNRLIRSAVNRARNKTRDESLHSGEEVLRLWYHERIPEVKSRKDLIDLIRIQGSEEFLCAREEDIGCLNVPRLKEFPDEIVVGESRLPVTYRFAPEQDDDGIEVVVAEEVLYAVPRHYWEWIFPSLWRPRVQWLVRRFKDEFKANGIGSERAVAAIVERIEEGYLPVSDRAGSARDGPAALGTMGFLEAMIDSVYVTCGVENLHGKVSAREFPDHLWVQIRVFTEKTSTWNHFRPPAEPLPSAIQTGEKRMPEWGRYCPWEKENITSWEWDRIPPAGAVGSEKQNLPLVGIPALCLEDNSIAFRTFWTCDAASQSHGAAVEQLIEIGLAEELAWAEKECELPEDLAELWEGIIQRDALEEWLGTFRYRLVFRLDTAVPWTREAFAEHLKNAWTKVHAANHDARQIARETGTEYRNCRRLLKKKARKSHGAFYGSIAKELDAELESYVTRFFDVRTPAATVMDIPRFLRALPSRIESAFLNPGRYRRRVRDIQELNSSVKELYNNGRNPSIEQRKELDCVRRSIEELAVTHFAPHLATSSVSQSSIEGQIADLRSRIPVRYR